MSKAKRKLFFGWRFLFKDCLRAAFSFALNFVGEINFNKSRLSISQIKNSTVARVWSCANKKHQNNGYRKTSILRISLIACCCLYEICCQNY